MSATMVAGFSPTRWVWLAPRLPAEFKAKCFAILDQVAATGEAVAILKRGRPVAELVPPVSTDSRYPQDDLRESVVIKADVVEPVLPAEAWGHLTGGCGRGSDPAGLVSS